MKDCPYKIGDKVLFQGKEYEISTIREDWYRGFDLYLKDRGWEYINLVDPISKGEQMTNKQEAKQQLEKLEAEVQKLKEIINKPEKAVSLLEEKGEYMVYNSDGKFCAVRVAYPYDLGANRFTSAYIAQAYSEAFNTMLALRKCEGSECCIDGKFQSAIGVSPFLEDLRVFNYTSSYAKFDTTSPMFISKEYAQAAIDKVGKENIIKMFKTLHGIYN